LAIAWNEGDPRDTALLVQNLSQVVRQVAEEASRRQPPTVRMAKEWHRRVRVRASGRRWFAVEWMRERRTRRLSLGEFGAVTVDQARERAKKILGRVAHGEDPAAQRAEERAAPTIAELARRYLEEHAAPKKKRSSVEGDERLLRLYVLPALARRKAAAVGLRDIADLHHNLRAKPVQANRVLALVSKMLNLAETWGLRPLHPNPCPRIGRYREGKRERFLSGGELRRLGEALSAVEQVR
jgi:Arm DNA-binding domain